MKLERSDKRGSMARLVLQASLVMGLLGTGSAHAEVSSFSLKAGIVAADDTTTWCIPSVVGTNRGSSKLRRVALDGTTTDNYVHTQASQKVKVQCFATSTLTGSSTVITSSSSTDAGGDIVQTATCPASKPYAGLARCQIDSGAAKPIFVYSGSECGDGITSLDLAWISGQMTGSAYEMNTGLPFPAPTGKTVFNNTLTNGVVAGTDMGFSFLAGGKLWFGFGDTWSTEDNVAQITNERSNVLYSSTDFNPSDANGIVFSDWEHDANAPQIAKENIVSYNNGSEDSAIPFAGFGLKEGNNAYRFQWYSSIDWDVPKVNWSALAYSKNGGAWVRAETVAGAPTWFGTTLFGSGAIYVDRYNRWLYFFGIKYDVNRPVRLARVRPTFAAVMDKKQYEYWNGSTWVADTNGDMTEVVAGTFSSAADIIPASNNTRGEISVAFSSYANRYIMLLWNQTSSEVELWQSIGVTGPWSKVNADFSMPDGWSVPCLYAPEMSDHTLRGGGQDIWFLLSQWCAPPPGSPAGSPSDPYNVGLWGVRSYRNTAANCKP